MQVKVFKRKPYRRTQRFVAITDRISGYKSGQQLNTTNPNDGERRYIKPALLIYYFKNYHIGQANTNWSKEAIKRFQATGRRSLNYIRIDNTPPQPPKLSTAELVKQQMAKAHSEFTQATDARVAAEAAAVKAEEAAKALLAAEEKVKAMDAKFEAEQARQKELAKETKAAEKDAIEKAMADAQAEKDALQSKLKKGTAKSADKPKPKPKPKKKESE